MEGQKISWLGRLAHDLRGPLSPLRMAADMLAQPGLPDADRAELIALVKRQVDTFGGMITELSDWASVSEGRLVGARQPTDLEWLLQNVVATLPPALAARVVIDAPEVIEVPADSHRLGQAFATLMRAREDLAPGETLQVAVSVSDPHTAHITFGAPVEGADSWINSQEIAHAGNTGLGLALPVAHAIIEAHGGHLEWQGQGPTRTWTCTLPTEGQSRGSEPRL